MVFQRKQQNRCDQTRAAMPANATSNAFNQQEDAFIASGCTERIYVCPHSKAELAYANLMSIKMMNAGATGKNPDVQKLPFTGSFFVSHMMSV